MSSQSGNPSTPTENILNSVTEHEQPQIEVQQDEKAGGDKQTVSVFVNSEPMREEQVKNAVQFLSHPKVRVSPVIYRRSFLEKKGLTKEEIDEAFRRVPDPPPSAVAANVSRDGQVKSPSNNQPQASIQTLQPAAATPSGAVSPTGTLQPSKFHWSHAILALGLLSISGAGATLIIKKKIIPTLKSWIRKIVKDEENEHVERESSKPSLEEDAAAAAKSAAEAAADVAKATQEMLSSKYEDSRKFEEFVSLLNAQLLEMKSLTGALQNLEGQRNVPGRASFTEQDHQVNVTYQKLYANGNMDYNFSAVKPSSLPMSVEPSIVRHPNSYMEQPGEFRQVPNNSNPIHESQRRGGNFNSTVQDNGQNYQLKGDSSVPWWQQRNVRITEIDNENNLKAGSSVDHLSEQPIKRTWVPPQPPPVIMPEAAEAIRRPKSTVVQTEKLADNQLVTPPDTSGEAQRISRNGSAGEVEIGEGSSKTNSSEIQEE